MASRLIRLTLMGALLGATGAQWVVLQSVAWTRMAMTGAKLDGSQPCAMCLKAQKGAESQKKQDAGPSSVRLKLFFAAIRAQRHVLVPLWAVPVVSEPAQTLDAAFDVPPPRLLAA